MGKRRLNGTQQAATGRSTPKGSLSTINKQARICLGAKRSNKGGAASGQSGWPDRGTDERLRLNGQLNRIVKLLEDAGFGASEEKPRCLNRK